MVVLESHDGTGHQQMKNVVKQIINEMFYLPYVQVRVQVREKVAFTYPIMLSFYPHTYIV